MKPQPRTRVSVWAVLAAVATITTLGACFVTKSVQNQPQQTTIHAVANSCKCAACPSCPAPSCGNAKGMALAAKKVFGYESSITDVETMQRHKPSFWKLPDNAFPAADTSMVDFWRQISPFMQEFRYSGNNGMFGSCDSAVLHGIVRHLKPKRVIEVGSGYSTHVVHQALVANSNETGIGFRHTCIEPYRASVLEGLGEVEVIENLVQEVDLELFDQLQAGDMLFLDNSHVIRPYGDVIFEFLWILPRLRPGVLVHIHDILLPYDYIPRWMDQELRQYTEQYMLAAFLYGNSNWKVKFHNGHMNNTVGHLLNVMNTSEKAEYLQLCSFDHEAQPTEALPGSIYLQRVA